VQLGPSAPSQLPRRNVWSGIRTAAPCAVLARSPVTVTANTSPTTTRWIMLPLRRPRWQGQEQISECFRSGGECAALLRVGTPGLRARFAGTIEQELAPDDQVHDRELRGKASIICGAEGAATEKRCGAEAAGFKQGRPAPSFPGAIESGMPRPAIAKRSPARRAKIAGTISAPASKAERPMWSPPKVIASLLTWWGWNPTVTDGRVDKSADSIVPLRRARRPLSNG
jgi:hypothetical protein